MMRRDRAHFALSLALAAAPLACSSPSERDGRDRGDAESVGVGPVTVRGPDELLELHALWSLETTGYVTGRPLVDGGAVYVADWSGMAFALDADTGEVLWRRQVGEPNRAWTWHGFSGTGALDGEAFYLASTEGVAYALDRLNGEILWSERFTDHPTAGNCGPILVHGTRLFVGLSSQEEGLSLEPGFEPSFTGSVVALDIGDGHELWRAPLVEPPQNGVAVWSGFAYDEETDTLYCTTGNNYTGEASELSDSIVAIDASHGTIRWSRQVTAGDVWTMAEPEGPDHDFAAAPQLFEATIGGRELELVGAGQKSGTYYAWDRHDGEPAWEARVSAGGIAGGIMAPAVPHQGQLYVIGNDAFAVEEPAAHPADIVALDQATGREIWRVSQAHPAALSGGAVADGIYYSPSLDGRVRGYRIADGRQMWASGPHASIGSTITAFGDTIFFGTGVPDAVGGADGLVGVFAYRRHR